MNLKMQRQCSQRSFLIADILALDKRTVSKPTAPDKSISFKGCLKDHSNNMSKVLIDHPMLDSERYRGLGPLSNSRIVLQRSNRLAPLQVKCPPTNTKDTNVCQDKMSSALNALIQMTTSTMDKLDHELHDSPTSFEPTLLAFYSKHGQLKKRRKTRTAFTNQQITELEHRFTLQKYLTPNDRDQIALNLGLSNAQVITWFQNRRAKMKRETEERRNDLLAAKRTSTATSSSSVANECSQDAVDLSVSRSPSRGPMKGDADDDMDIDTPSLDHRDADERGSVSSILSSPPELTAADRVFTFSEVAVQNAIQSP